MTLYSVKRDNKILQCHAFLINWCIWWTMWHECKIKLLHVTSIKHNYLTAQCFFCRCAIYHKLKRIVLHHIFYRNCSSDSCRSLHVMSARMSNIFKCIVLYEYSKHRCCIFSLIIYCRPAVIPCCPKSSIKRYSSLNSESLILQIVGQQFHWLVFLCAFFCKIIY